jgi:hypothetical protein
MRNMSSNHRQRGAFLKMHDFIDQTAYVFKNHIFINYVLKFFFLFLIASFETAKPNKYLIMSC